MPKGKDRWQVHLYSGLHPADSDSVEELVEILKFSLLVRLEKDENHSDDSVGRLNFPTLGFTSIKKPPLSPFALIYLSYLSKIEQI